jgi:hypothetical protein
MSGDCDSKAVLFVSILVHLLDQKDIILLHTTNHVLSAVADNSAYGTHMNHSGRRYFLAETAGPRRLDFGKRGRYFAAGYRIEDLRLTDSRLFNPIPYSRSNAIAANTRRDEYSSSRSYSGTSSTGGSGSSTSNTGGGSIGGESGSYGGNYGSGGSSRIEDDDISNYEWERRGSKSMFAVDVSSFFKLGGGISYYQGNAMSRISEFSTSYPSYVAMASLGFPLSNYHYLIFDGTVGLPTTATLVEQQRVHTGTDVVAVDVDRSVFWEVDGGLLLFRFLRASVGYGQQEIATNAIEDTPSNMMKKDYYCATAGLVLRFGRISLDFGLTAFDGRDYERIGVRAQGLVNVYIW